MNRARQVAGGGRAVEVPPERLAGWFERFAARNEGVTTTAVEPDRMVVSAANGTTATIDVPFGRLPVPAGVVDGLDVDALVEHVTRARRIGLVLVRLGAHSVGIAEGDKVVASRTDRHLVHGRTSAGGWSQQRFARRREKQAREALTRVARDVADVLGAGAARLDAVVLGGDRRALDELRADGRLASIFALAERRVLDIGEPRRTVLDEAAKRARTVEIVVRDRK